MCPFHVFARFLRFPRHTRFRLFCPFWPFLLFRLVISPYPATERARSTFSPFSPTCTFSPVLPVFAVSDGDFTISRRPNVPVPRFLRFPRHARFRPFWSFSPFLLFRLVISPYRSDRTCPLHVFSVFPELHVFARFGRFCCFGW